MPVDAVLTTRDLCFSFNGVRVLNDISFQVGAGDYLGIVGPNGSGKSTLIRAILGLEQPDSGLVELFGTPGTRFNEWRRIGYLPQRLKFFNANFPATVEEIVRLGLLAGKKMPRSIKKGDDEAVAKTLELMGITGIRRKLIGDLSGGQQQRVLLARAIVGEPELLILDEPTSALDPETRENFYALLERLNRERKTTVILVTHDTWSIGKYANRFLYLDKKIIFNGTFDDFCHSPEMTGFFGESAQHMICHRH
jgi:zinc transport system ATP-binding protein